MLQASGPPVPDFMVNWVGNPVADHVLAFLHNTYDIPWCWTIIGLTVTVRLVISPIYLVCTILPPIYLPG